MVKSVRQGGRGVSECWRGRGEEETVMLSQPRTRKRTQRCDSCSCKCPGCTHGIVTRSAESSLRRRVYMLTYVIVWLFRMENTSRRAYLVTEQVARADCIPRRRDKAAQSMHSFGQHVRSHNCRQRCTLLCVLFEGKTSRREIIYSPLATTARRQCRY